MPAAVHVAVGVLRDEHGRVLIALRPSDKHQGNLWEFPGGKIEAGEQCEQALRRELHEELNITVHESRPLIRVPFSYKDKSVLLDVREVIRFSGTPIGNEGQEVRWVNPNELNSYSFPAANVPIVSAIQLPDCIAVTGKFENEGELASGIECALKKGAGMILFRPAPGIYGVANLIEVAEAMCARHGKLFAVSSFIGQSLWGIGSGLHLTSKDLMGLMERPVGRDKWLGASCHNREELEWARKIGVDYAFLSPVQKTESHPMTEPIGWEGFKSLVFNVGIPVYALGGVSRDDLEMARNCGAKGIAAIRDFWCK